MLLHPPISKQPFFFLSSIYCVNPLPGVQDPWPYLIRHLTFLSLPHPEVPAQFLPLPWSSNFPAPNSSSTPSLTPLSSSFATVQSFPTCRYHDGISVSFRASFVLLFRLSFQLFCCHRSVDFPRGESLSFPKQGKSSSKEKGKRTRSKEEEKNGDDQARHHRVRRVAR